MQSEYKGSKTTVIASVEKANGILINDSFYARIALHDDFDFTDETPARIAQWIKESTHTVNVRLYKGRFRSKATAYVDHRFPNTLFLNSRKLDRDPLEITNTIIHECVHVVDLEHVGSTFGHAGNDRNGKGNSAPYWIGSLAERILRGQKSAEDGTIVDNPVRFIEESMELDANLILDE